MTDDAWVEEVEPKQPTKDSWCRGTMTLEQVVEGEGSEGMASRDETTSSSRAERSRTDSERYMYMYNYINVNTSSKIQLVLE